MDGHDAKQTHRIMLSGFDTHASKSRAAEIIQRLGGMYVCDEKNSQAFVPSCTHVVFKKLSRTEKYICACASGKWILTPQYLEESKGKGHWVSEIEYEWGANISPRQSHYFIMAAPKRWRERLKVKGGDPPFLGWNVGLIMTDALTDAYKRILTAGGGEAIDVSSWHNGTGAAVGAERKEEMATVLTHILVFPTFANRISRSRIEDVPYVRSDFLAMQLIKDPAPSVEEYLLFRDSKSKAHRQGSPASKSKKVIAKAIKSSRNATVGSKFSTSAILSNTSAYCSPQFPPSKPITRHQEKMALLHQAQENKATPRSQGSGSGPKPLPASVLAKSSLVFSTPNLAVPSSTSSPVSQAATAGPRGSVMGAIEGLAAIKMPVAWSSPISIQIASAKAKAANAKGHHVPTISLGSAKKKEESVDGDASAKKATKRRFSDEFFEQNEAVIREFAARKKREQSSYGIILEMVNFEDGARNLHRYRSRKMTMFSREELVFLQASLEFPDRYDFFLEQVSSFLSPTVYPQPEVLYIIMRVILLDAESPALAAAAFSVLTRILTIHPPQEHNVKEGKLYHKALSVMTVPDTEEMSELMTSVSLIMTRTSADDWRFWCSKDSNLATHWTFVSRVLRVAIEPASSSIDDDQRASNAALLITFLTDLVVKDYYDVMTMKSYPAHSPMIKCFIADLLWPSMTGLEPWYRRQSANLADMVALFVKAAAVYATFSGSPEADNDSDDGFLEDEFILSREATALQVLTQVGRLMTVTASWCVHCDMRDRDRQTKRMSSRTLEHELVLNLRSELENKTSDVIDLALRQLPHRLRLEAIVALMQHTCSDALTQAAAETKRDEELSLEWITAHLLQMFPAVRQGEERKFPGRNSAEDISSSQEGRKHEGTTRLDMATVTNKRNAKGATSLHTACMSNKPEMVKYVLDQPGIDPNATDRAGWTPLGEACYHGHIECVKALLGLPLSKPVEDGKKDDGQASTGSGKPPPWEINLTLCPEEGLTPLHDALANSYHDIARLLLRKGGIELLDKLDSQGKCPLDHCPTESARTSIITYARRVAEVRGRKRKVHDNSDLPSDLMALAPADEYQKVLPRKSVLTEQDWRERVKWLSDVTRYLLASYVASGHLLQACKRIEMERPLATSLDINTAGSDAPSRVCSESELERYANDMVYCLRWKECWDSYHQHLNRVLGGSEGSMANVTVDTQSPIPLNLMDSFSSAAVESCKKLAVRK